MPVMANARKKWYKWRHVPVFPFRGKKLHTCELHQNAVEIFSNVITCNNPLTFFCHKPLTWMGDTFPSVQKWSQNIPNIKPFLVFWYRIGIWNIFYVVDWIPMTPQALCRYAHWVLGCLSQQVQCDGGNLHQSCTCVLHVSNCCCVVSSEQSLEQCEGMIVIPPSFLSGLNCSRKLKKSFPSMEQRRD